MEPPPRPTPSPRSTFPASLPTSRTSRSRVTATPATPGGLRNARLRWTDEMEEAMLEGLLKAVRKGYRADSFYKANGWKIALNRTLAIT
jgi:hypothetical protein